LVALKLAWYIGLRSLRLLGVDWHFSAGGSRPYAHTAPKSDEERRKDNAKFAVLAARVGELRPVLEGAGLYVTNHTQGSALEVFQMAKQADL
jgi:hypothetical protein